MFAAAMNAKTATCVREAVGSHPSVIEPKLDGWRVLAERDLDGAVRMFTRGGTDLTGKMPQIEEELTSLLTPGSMIDGEVVAFAIEDGRLSHKWGTVQSVLGAGNGKAAERSKALTYVAFDLLRYDGADARGLSYANRRELLGSVIDGAERVQLIPTFDADEETYEQLVGLGYEGAVVKWTDAPYASGKRGAGWFKLKATATIDVVVMSFEVGADGFGTFEFGQYDEAGVLVPRGRCKNHGAERLAVNENPELYIGRVFELAHMGVMPESAEGKRGGLRHPTFLRFREDKPASEVTIHDA